MKVCGVLPLLDVNCAMFQRNRFDLAESRAADASEVLASPQICILQWKAVTMYWGLCRAADRSNERQSRKRGAFFQ
jgi:hypothetical protein